MYQTRSELYNLVIENKVFGIGYQRRLYRQGDDVVNILGGKIVIERCIFVKQTFGK